jgi:hypothetical protein
MRILRVAGGSILPGVVEGRFGRAFSAFAMPQLARPPQPALEQAGREAARGMLRVQKTAYPLG